MVKDESTPTTYRDRILTARRLRRLLKGQRGAALPTGLALLLLHRLPEIAGRDAGEILIILEQRANTITDLLEQDGIDLFAYRASDDPPHLTVRERLNIANLAALYCWSTEAARVLAAARTGITDSRDRLREQSKEAIRRSLVLARLVEDRRQEVVTLMTKAEVLMVTTEDPEEISDLQNEAKRLIVEEATPDDHDGNDLLLWIRTRITLRSFSNGENEKAAEGVDRIEEMLEERDLPSANRVRPILHRVRAEIAMRQGNHRLALVETRTAVALSRPDIDPIRHCQLLQTLGRLYTQMEHRDQGLRYYLDAIEILEEQQLVPEGFWLYLSAASTYEALGDTEAGHAMLDRLAEQLHFKKGEAPDEVSHIAVNFRTSRARILLGEGEYDRALALLEPAIDDFRAIGSPYNVAITAHLAAKGERGRGNHDMACRYLERAVAVSQRSSHVHRIRFRLALARALVDNDRCDDAATMIEGVASIIEKEGRQYIFLLRIRSALCERTGDLTKALRFEREATERERNFIAIDRERSARFGRIVAETHLLEQSVEKERDHRQRLEHALANAVVELGAKKEMIEKVVEALRKESASRRVGEEGITASRFYTILASLRADEEPTSTLSFLGPAADEFLTRLRIVHPQLTTSQQRFCSLLRFGLSATEIYTILGIGVEGLKSRRKRLRKALGVAKGESLDRMIAQI